MDPDIDFGVIFEAFDTVLMGRRTFEFVMKSGNGSMPGMKTFVFSRTLRQRDHPKVTILNENPEETLASIRAHGR
jgi:dihydrofolate reductase